MSLLDDVSIVVTPNGYKAGELYAVIPVPTEGAELLSQPVNLVADFNNNAGGVIVDADTFTTAGGTFDGLVSSTNIFEIGKRYKLIISGNTTSSGLGFYPGGGSGNYGEGFGTHYFTATHGKLWVRQVTAGTTNITSFSIKEYTSADMDVTRATAATRVDENGLVNYAEVVSDTEEITNGDFATDSDWTKGTGWSISGGKANGLATTGQLYQSTNTTINTIYKIEYTISNYVGGTYNFLLRGNSSPSFSGNGTFTLYLTSGSGGNSNFIIDGVSAFTGSIDNVSVKEVTRDNVPRIDYTGGGCPHILAEPQRTNRFLYSEDLTQFNLSSSGTSASNPTVTSNYGISPDGTQNADRVQFNAGTDSSGNSRITETFSIFATEETISVYLKSNDGQEHTIDIIQSNQAQNTATVTTEWQRFSFTNTNSSPDKYGIGLTGANGETADILAWGFQLEQASYPTSYIPTSGSTVTRNQDIFTRDGIGSLINSTEGVLFVEVAVLSETDSFRTISISDGTVSNRINIWFWNDGTVKIDSYSSGSVQFTYDFDIDTTLFNKIAVKYKLNDFSVFLNGLEVFTDSAGVTPLGLNQIKFSNPNNLYYLLGKVKQLQVYKTALTDNQLIQLTGEAGTHFFESYAEMAEALTYTIQ